MSYDGSNIVKLGADHASSVVIGRPASNNTFTATVKVDTVDVEYTTLEVDAGTISLTTTNDGPLDIETGSGLLTVDVGNVCSLNCASISFNASTITLGSGNINFGGGAATAAPSSTPSPAPRRSCSRMLTM